MSSTVVNVLWLAMAALFVLMIYRFNKLNKQFNAADLFMNYTLYPPRADLTSVILFMMALMAIWVCVVRSNEGKDVDNLVLGVLGIFVLRQAVKIGADAYVQKPAAPPAPPDAPQPVTQQVNVGQAAPQAPQIGQAAPQAPVPSVTRRNVGANLLANKQRGR